MKPKILFFTSNPPENAMGGSLLFHRQFVERSDFDVFVITDKSDFISDSFPSLNFRHPQLIQRLRKTRLHQFTYDYDHLIEWRRIPREISNVVESFMPDLVLASAETWIADLAISVVNRYKLPLAAHFMDWPTYSMKGHHWLSRYAEHRFRARYRACDLAFVICPEMLEALGPHRNPCLFYPFGPPAPTTRKEHTRGGKFKLLFAGNLGQWYGEMVFDLAVAIEGCDTVDFRVAGTNARWTTSQVDYLVDRGIYLGFLKGDEYERQLSEADALLVIMGFDPKQRMIESTSFKSKLADYLTLNRPVIVWGPEYSTAVRHANREGFGAVVDVLDPSAVADTARRLAEDPERCRQLAERGALFYKNQLHPDRVLQNALNAKLDLIGKF